MKQSEVQNGGEYLTKVSGRMVLVTVTASIDGRMFGQRTRFTVKRKDNGRVLNGRTAASLRKTKMVGNSIVDDKSKPEIKNGLSQKELDVLDSLDDDEDGDEEEDGDE